LKIFFLHGTSFQGQNRKVVEVNHNEGHHKEYLGPLGLVAEKSLDLLYGESPGRAGKKMEKKVISRPPETEGQKKPSRYGLCFG
jgi:hypothetical protein